MEPVPVDLLIFDLDGTLTDSLRDISRSANYTLTQLGFEPLPEEQIRSYIGDGIPQLLERCLNTHTVCTSELLDRAVEIYRPYYNAHCLDHVTLYPHVREILDWFSEKIKAVISNKMESYTEKILQALNLRGYFKAVIGGDTLPKRKPDPMPVLELLKRFDVPASRAVIIGDGHQDVFCGKSAGIYTCAVTYGFQQSPELAQADFRVDNLMEIKSLFI